MPDDETLVDEPDLATITTELELLVATLKATSPTDTAALEKLAGQLNTLTGQLEAVIPEV